MIPITSPCAADFVLPRRVHVCSTPPVMAAETTFGWVSVDRAGRCDPSEAHILPVSASPDFVSIVRISRSACSLCVGGGMASDICPFTRSPIRIIPAHSLILALGLQSMGCSGGWDGLHFPLVHLPIWFIWCNPLLSRVFAMRDLMRPAGSGTFGGGTRVGFSFFHSFCILPWTSS
jgi:hypothetical protein